MARKLRNFIKVARCLDSLNSSTDFEDVFAGTYTFDFGSRFLPVTFDFLARRADRLRHGAVVHRLERGCQVYGKIEREVVERAHLDGYVTRYSKVADTNAGRMLVIEVSE